MGTLAPRGDRQCVFVWLSAFRERGTCVRSSRIAHGCACYEYDDDVATTHTYFTK